MEAAFSALESASVDIGAVSASALASVSTSDADLESVGDAALEWEWQPADNPMRLAGPAGPLDFEGKPAAR